MSQKVYLFLLSFSSAHCLSRCTYITHVVHCTAGLVAKRRDVAARDLLVKSDKKKEFLGKRRKHPDVSNTQSVLSAKMKMMPERLLQALHPNIPHMLETLNPKSSNSFLPCLICYVRDPESHIIKFFSAMPHVLC